MNPGRDRSAEAEAEAIMNQSDESVEDLVVGTEVGDPYEADDEIELEEGDLLDDIGEGDDS